MKIFNLLLAAARTAAERLIPRIQFEPLADGFHLLAVLSRDTGKGALRVYVHSFSNVSEIWVTLNAKHTGSAWIADQTGSTAHAVRYTNDTGVGVKPITYLVDDTPVGNISWSSTVYVTSGGVLAADTITGDHTGTIDGVSTSLIRPVAAGLIHTSRPLGGGSWTNTLLYGFGVGTFGVLITGNNLMTTTLNLSAPPTHYFTRADALLQTFDNHTYDAYALVLADAFDQSPNPSNQNVVKHVRRDGGLIIPSISDKIDIYISFTVHKIG